MNEEKITKISNQLKENIESLVALHEILCKEGLGTIGSIKIFGQLTNGKRYNLELNYN